VTDRDAWAVYDADTDTVYGYVPVDMAHPATWLTDRPLPAAREYDRREMNGDPDPWAEVRSPWLWLAAVVCFLGLVAGLALVIAVVPGP
jgi:hypothetical protein